jgi:hypothetical protein
MTAPVKYPGRYSREKDVYHIKFMGDDNSGHRGRRRLLTVYY